MCDITSAIEYCTHPNNHNQTKYYDLNTAFNRESVEMGLVKLKSVSTKNNLADPLTKPLDIVDQQHFL